MKAEDDKNTSIDDSNAGTDKANTSTEGAEGEGKQADASDAEPKEEEPKTLTLDEWKAQQGKKEGPKFNTRKAGEGSDIDPKWKKTYAYKKEKENAHDDDDEEVKSHTW